MATGAFLSAASLWCAPRAVTHVGGHAAKAKGLSFQASLACISRSVSQYAYLSLIAFQK
jgi:hypothetical protein